MMSKYSIILLLIFACTSAVAGTMRKDIESADKAPIESIADIRCYFAMAEVHKHLGNSIKNYGVSFCKVDVENNRISITLKKSPLSFGGVVYDLDMSNMSIVEIGNER